MGTYARLTDILLGHWQAIKGDRPFPAENEVDVAPLAPIWDDCFLIQSCKERQYRYDYLGKHLIEAYGEDACREEIDILVSPYGRGMIEKFNIVADSGAPLHDDGIFSNARHIEVRYRQLLLPLGHDGVVTHILGGMRWKLL